MRVRRAADLGAGGCAILLGFLIPFPVAAANLALGLTLLFWLLGGRYRAKFAAIRANPVAVAALLLFLWLAVSALWGDRADGWRYLNKYTSLLMLPLLIPLFLDPYRRRLGLWAFGSALTLILLLSYTIKLGLPPDGIFVGDTQNPVVFKLHITHNVLMALGAFLFALAAQTATRPSHRAIFAALALLAVFDVVFLVLGRTGYVVLAALFGYFCFARLHAKGLVVAAAAATLLFGAAYVASSAFHSRIDKAVSEFFAWRPAQASETSVGQRLEFWRNSLALIRAHPVFGVGTGSFSKAYADVVTGTGQVETHNPHNEYLLVAVQTGVIGLALLLHLFWRQWHEARRLPLFEQQLARALTLTIAVGCLFNSLLIDHTESLLFGWLSALLFAGLPQKAP